MFPKFFEAVGESLGKGAGESFVNRLFGPAALFWGTGLAIYIWAVDWPDLSQLDMAAQLIWIAVAVGVIVLSDVVMEWFTLPVLRRLEGYSWPKFLRQWAIARLSKAITAKNNEWQILGQDLRKFDCLNEKIRDELTPEEKQWLDTARQKQADWQRKRVDIDWFLNDYPVNPKYLMPTKLGNFLRTAEIHPYERYGLEAITVWPRLWLVVPEQARRELSTARLQLDIAVRLIIWGMLWPVIWSPMMFWLKPLSSSLVSLGLVIYFLPVLIGVLIIVIGYYARALPAARLYGALVRSVFDLYRFDLYKQMNWPLPEKNNEEKNQGEQLTQYLFRGFTQLAIILEHQKD